MKKWQKTLLSLLSIGYLIGLALMLWPRFFAQCLQLLRQWHLNLDGNSQVIGHYYGLTLLGITLLIFLMVMFLPSQKHDVPLRVSSSGRLALSNDGITHFIQTQLSGEGLTNIRVKIKNTRHRRRFRVVADTTYQQHMVAKLPRLKQTLTDQLTTLLAGVNDVPVKIDMQINQANHSKRKTSRVI